MIEKNINSLSLWFFENLQEHGSLTHFISNRTGGFSTPPHDSLNLGFHVEDNPQRVLRNRELLASTLDVPLYNFTLAQQVHDGGVKVVTEDLKGRGATTQKTALNETDSLVTDVPDICLMVLVADCLPLLFFDTKKNIIGAAHAGWRGTVRFVAQNTVRVLQERFGSVPKDILVGMGPCIGPCCYEVGEDVISEFNDLSVGKEGFVKKRSHDGRGYLDLWKSNESQLLEMGIPEENIESSGICTCCNHSSFFSHRYEKGGTGRFGAGIMINGS